MGRNAQKKSEEKKAAPAGERALRADAQRNIDALLEAAKVVFVESGVDAPVREIAMRAGVGVGTVYRHFPQRSDLVAAVFRREVDACAAAAPVLAAEHAPFEALTKWFRRFTRFIATKRGLAKALHSGDPAFESLPAYFAEHLLPALDTLVATAEAAGEIRRDLNPPDLLRAVSNLSAGGDEAASQRMIALLLDGLRFGGSAQPGKTSSQTRRHR